MIKLFLHRIITYLKYRKNSIVPKDENFSFVSEFYKHVILGREEAPELEEIRKSLYQDDTILEVIDLGAGSVLSKKNSQRKVSDIAKRALKNKKNASFLSTFVKFMDGAQFIELGTSLGLTTLYLQKYSNSPVISIEGSPEIHNRAKSVINSAKLSIEPNLMLGNFDDVLPDILDKITSDFVLYIDGNHSYEATIRYFQWAMKKKSLLRAIVFDDIYWSPDMTRAWEEIRNHSEVILDIDLYQFGIVFMTNVVENKESISLLY